MKARQVEVFTLGRSVMALEANYVQFLEYPPLALAPRGTDWLRPINNAEVVVRHAEPVVYVQMPDGQRVCLAIEPRLFRILSYAVDGRMAEKLAAAEADNKRLGSALCAAKDERDQGWQKANEASTSYQLANAKLMEIAGATFWRRLKYLFTGSLK